MQKFLDKYFAKIWQGLTGLFLIYVFYFISPFNGFILVEGEMMLKLFLVIFFGKLILSVLSIVILKFNRFALADMLLYAFNFFVFKYNQWGGGAVLILSVFLCFTFFQVFYIFKLKLLQFKGLKLAFLLLYIAQIWMSFEVITTIMHWPRILPESDWIYISATLFCILAVNFSEIEVLSQDKKSFLFQHILPLWIMGFLLYSSIVYNDWLSGLYIDPIAFGISLSTH